MHLLVLITYQTIR